MESKKHVFSLVERKHFLDILKKYSSIIENKNTDGASLRNKNEAWIRITAEYNASTFARKQATTKQLRRLWINTKQRQKVALIKKRLYKIPSRGESPLSNSGIDSDAAMVSPSLIIGIDSAIDSNAVDDPLKSNIPDSKIKMQDTIFLPSVSRTSDRTYVEPESPQASTFQLCQPLTGDIPPFKSDTPPSTSTGTLQFKNRIFLQEHKDRSVRASEKHNLEMLILKEQIREAKAKADLAELLLTQKLDATDP